MKAFNKFTFILFGLFMVMECLLLGVYALNNKSVDTTTGLTYLEQPSGVNLERRIYKSTISQTKQELVDMVEELANLSFEEIEQKQLVHLDSLDDTSTADESQLTNGIKSGIDNLTLNFASSGENIAYSYFIVMNVENTTSYSDIYAVMQDERVECENIFEYDNALQENILKNETDRNIVIGLTPEDINTVASSTSFTYGINVASGDVARSEQMTSKYTVTNGAYTVNTDAKGVVVLDPTVDGVTRLSGLSSLSSVTSFIIREGINSIPYQIAIYKNQKLTKLVLSLEEVEVASNGFIQDNDKLYTIRLTDSEDSDWTSKNNSGQEVNCIIQKSSKTLIIGSNNTKFNKLPEYVETIGESSFCYCRELKTLDLRDGVINIQSKAFWWCDGITTITIPSSVTSIAYDAFGCCEGVKELNYNANLTINYAIRESPFSYSFGSDEGIRVNIGKDGDKNISIPSNLFSTNVIGDSHITSVVIKNNVTSIGQNAFASCRYLSYITIPNNVTKIGNGAFSRTAITEITIPSSITNVNDIKYSLTGSKIVQVRNNSSLDLTLRDLGINGQVGAEISKTGTFTNTLVKGDKYTSFIVGDKTYLMGFTNPIQETTANDIPNNINEIYSQAFEECINLTTVKIPNSVTSIGTDAFFNCTGLTSVNLGSGINSIGQQAFRSCSSLTSIFIPDSVKSLKSDSFSWCTNLTDISIGTQIDEIGLSAFNGTGYYNSDNWQDNVLYLTSRDGIVKYLLKANTSISGHYSIDNQTILIADSAFSYCTGLTSIEIPNSVKYINSNAFYNCTGVTQLNYNANITTQFTSSNAPFRYMGSSEGMVVIIGKDNDETTISIPNYLFYDNSNVKSVEIKNNVTSIGNCSFFNCKSLTSVDLGSVQSIGSYAFRSCTGLTSITIPSTTTTIGSYAFYDWTQEQSIYFEGESYPENLDAYWKNNCNAKIYLNGVLQN